MNYAIGTYTTIQPHVPGACGKGIHISGFSTQTGELIEKHLIEDIEDPTYLHWSNKTKTLSAITESPDDKGRISSFSIDSSLIVNRSGSVEGPGASGCHIAYYPDTNRLYAAAYMDSCISVYPAEGGQSGESICSWEYPGSGPNKARQEASHAHMVLRSPDRRLLYVCDLGSDRIWMHKLDETGNAGPPAQALEVPAGYGPRHMAIGEAADTAYILCELIPRLLTAEIRENGTMDIISDESTVKEPVGNPANPAAIKLHPSGRTLAVSNRFQDTIGVFSIKDDDRLKPVLIDEFDCRGRTPRDIEFSPEGDWLLIANQDSDSITIRRFNPESGRPEEGWGPNFDIGSPVCITGLEGLN